MVPYYHSIYCPACRQVPPVQKIAFEQLQTNIFPPNHPFPGAATVGCLGWLCILIIIPIGLSFSISWVLQETQLPYNMGNMNIFIVFLSMLGIIFLVFLMGVLLITSQEQLKVGEANKNWEYSQKLAQYEQEKQNLSGLYYCAVCDVVFEPLKNFVTGFRPIPLPPPEINQPNNSVDYDPGLDRAERDRNSWMDKKDSEPRLLFIFPIGHLEKHDDD